MRLGSSEARVVDSAFMYVGWNPRYAFVNLLYKSTGSGDFGILGLLLPFPIN